MKRAWLFLKTYLQTRYFTRYHSRDQLESWQNKRLQKLLNEICLKSEFYKKHLDRNVQNFKSLPLMNKNVMMENFDTLNTVGLKKQTCFDLVIESERTREFKSQIGQYTIGLSSGTSGHRGLFAVSDNEQVHWAAVLLAKALPFSILHQQKITLFLRSNSNLYESLNIGKVTFNYCDPILSVEHHVEALNKNQPTVLVAPPSILKALGRLKLSGALTIAPEKIFSVAEVLEASDKTEIEKYFNTSIFQIYQATEGFLACSCAHGNLHLNEDLVIIEKHFIDQSTKRFQPIITDLFRTTQPVIRYLLNDILIEKPGLCPCSSIFQMIEKIEGRSDDVFYFPDQNNSLKPVWPDFISRAVGYVPSTVDNFSVTQLTDTLVEVAFSTSCNRQVVESEIRSEFQILFEKFQVQIPVIQFAEYKKQDALTKLRRIRRATNIL